MQSYYQGFIISFQIFSLTRNLGIIYYVTIAVTWDETNTNKYEIYQPTCLQSFVTFDLFYFCLWPRTLKKEKPTTVVIVAQKRNISASFFFTEYSQLLSAACSKKLPSRKVTVRQRLIIQVPS